ncbi:MAG TPA: hypothetical protein VFZ98_05240 [Vicinamibacterales bacterium]
MRKEDRIRQQEKPSQDQRDTQSQQTKKEQQRIRDRAPDEQPTKPQRESGVLPLPD